LIGAAINFFFQGVGIMNKLRIGVIGCGYWGPNLIRNFADLPTAELVAVADLREERLAAAKCTNHDLYVTRNYQDLFDMNLEGLVIATPPATHYPIAKEALEHELNVMVEKPLTTSSKHAEELVNLAAQKGKVLMVGHTFMFNNAVHALKKLVDSGEIGRIHYVDTARLNLGLYSRDLNVLWDLAPHDLSIISYLLGQDPVSIEVFGTSCVIKNVFDVVHMNIIYPGNILAHVHVSWLDPCKVRRVTVVGSKKMVVYNDLEPSEKIKIYDKGVETPEYTTTYGEFQCSYRYGDIVIPNIKFTEPLRQECSHFIECITDHAECRSSGMDGLKVVRILEAAQNSLMNGHHEEVLAW
jgi:predicted dehydrogenase